MTAMMHRNKVIYVSTVEYLTEAVANGRRLTPGVEVSIRGERGRFRFQNATVTSSGRTVLNFVGGAAGHEVFRSFYPERVRRVHRINRTRRNFSEAGRVMVTECPTPFKLRFACRREARLAAVDIRDRMCRQRGRKRVVKSRPVIYECRCGGYHLTSGSRARIRLSTQLDEWYERER